MGTVFLTTLQDELNMVLGISGLILLFGLGLKRLSQPYIIAYILTGIILGPYGFKLVTEVETAEVIGELGLIILLFFIGVEISLEDFIKRWRVALFGTGLQVIFSILLVFALGFYMGWDLSRVFLLGFIISLSSSAVVIKLIDDQKLDHTSLGQSLISILLTQDVLIAPMIIIMSFFSKGEVDYGELGIQVLGAGFVMGLLIFLLRKKTLKLPFEKYFRADHELQVFASLIICFGLALITSLFGLSAGLGAFLAGLFVHSTPSAKWLHDSLHSFRVILISVFFLSVGMLIDLQFLRENWGVISLLVLGVFISNQGINALSLRSLGTSWKESIYGGAFLAQIGEFSFVLASLGYHNQLISSFTYQLTLIVIAITIFISPLWVQLNQKVLGIPKGIKPIVREEN